MRIQTHSTTDGIDTVHHGSVAVEAPLNHDAVAATSSVEAAQLALNRNAIAVKSGVKAGRLTENHSAVAVKSGVQAGGLQINHNATQAGTALTPSHHRETECCRLR